MQHLFRLGVDIDFSDDDGFMALHHAVLSGFEDCVQELIDRGSDVNAMTKHGVPLNLAAQKERGRVVSILVDARADKHRAVAFAVAHGRDVEYLRSLLDTAAPRAGEEEPAASSVDFQDIVERGRRFVTTSVYHEAQKLPVGTESNDKAEHLYDFNTGGSATTSERLHVTDPRDRSLELYDNNNQGEDISEYYKTYLRVLRSARRDELVVQSFGF